MKTITLHSPLDMHLHLRDGEMLKTTAPLSARYFSGGVIMPNIYPIVKDKASMLAYKERILEACGEEAFNPLMTVYLHEDLSIEMLQEAIDAGLHGVKLYPLGVTTNSDEGAKTIFNPHNETVFAFLQEHGIPLLIHGESSGFCMRREQEFLDIFEKLAGAYPKLKIIAEHITTKELAQLIQTVPNLYGTITLHHLVITLDDVIGGFLNPHNFCKPIAKTPADKEALLEMALNAHEKVCFGSDSAPHPRDKKESSAGAAGIFTAPIALPFLAEIFEKNGKLNFLQTFISDNAKRIFNLKNIPDKQITLVKQRSKIPTNYENIVPFFAGGDLEWSYCE